jgi:hypothetical protein
MKKMLLSKKWILLAVTVIMLVASLVIPAAVLATGTDWEIHGPWSSQGTYVDVMVNGGPALPGWCVSSAYITPGDHYNATVYDIFGDYYPDLSSLPTCVKNVDWCAVSYIINHKDGYTKYQIQDAIWHFTNAGSSNALSNAAEAYFAANGCYIPGCNEIKPMVGFIACDIQLTFYEAPVPCTPPIPEMPAGALFGMGLGVMGLMGLGGWYGVRKNHPKVV